MSLVLVTLSLLTAPSAQAQSCGSGVYDHCWQINYSNSNNVNLHNVRDVPTIGQSTPTQSSGGSSIIDGDEESTVTTTLTWMPANGDSVMDPPPDKDHPVHIEEYGYAYESSLWGGSGSAPSGAGTADDGLGDPRDVNGVSQGNHLLQRDGSSGTITLDPVIEKAINPVSTYQSGYPGGGGDGGGGYPGGGGPGWDWTGGIGTINFNVALDSSASPRSVTITSSIDPTYHKDPVLGKVANTPDGSGTIKADSVNLWDGAFGPDITYYANPTGSWSAGSAYHWYSAVTGTSNAGTFTLPGDPPYAFPVWYDAFLSGQEHINLNCTDAGDGANASANYYVNWHKPIETWTRSSIIYHPLPTAGPTDPNNIGEWQVYGSFANNDPLRTPPNTESCALSAQQTFTVAGTIGGQQTTTVTGSDVAEAFQTNESITVSKAYQSSSTQTYTAQIPPGGVTYVYWGVGWTDRSGTCDLYDEHGFNSTVPWDAHEANLDSQNNLVISWATYSTAPSP